MSNTLDAFTIGQELDYKDAAEMLETALNELGVSIIAKFVPWNESRAKDENDSNGNAAYSIQWKIDVMRIVRGKNVCILPDIEYGTGIAHTPGYGGAHDKSAKGHVQRYIARVCESGRYLPGKLSYEAIDLFCRGRGLSSKDLPAPSVKDVMSCLFMDSDVLNYSCFEEWAANFGYDPDSRKGEATYRACLEQALTLRAAFGNDQLEKLCYIAGQM